MGGRISPSQRSRQPIFILPEARERIARTIPHCKIICTLRDPVSRLYSLYHFMRHYGFTRVSFERALKDFPFMMGSSRYAHHVSGSTSSPGRWSSSTRT